MRGSGDPSAMISASLADSWSSLRRTSVATLESFRELYVRGVVSGFAFEQAGVEVCEFAVARSDVLTQQAKPFAASGFDQRCDQKAIDRSLWFALVDQGNEASSVGARSPAGETGFPGDRARTAPFRSARALPRRWWSSRDRVRDPRCKSSSGSSRSTRPFARSARDRSGSHRDAGRPEQANATSIRTEGEA